MEIVNMYLLSGSMVVNNNPVWGNIVADPLKMNLPVSKLYSYINCYPYVNSYSYLYSAGIHEKTNFRYKR